MTISESRLNGHSRRCALCPMMALFVGMGGIVGETNGLERINIPVIEVLAAVPR
ncbi:hypothetical protein [Martelella sp. HB161492]|uniref:hypothetical protein n=1 Tax=Martelella sp. HB161492 TaxID=2720726 RepID=UPI001591D9A5|nr:hypothetical protein [Martelella sp. HB161492]